MGTTQAYPQGSEAYQPLPQSSEAYPSPPPPSSEAYPPPPPQSSEAYPPLPPPHISEAYPPPPQSSEAYSPPQPQGMLPPKGIGESPEKGGANTKMILHHPFTMIISGPICKSCYICLTDKTIIGNLFSMTKIVEIVAIFL